MQGLQNLGSTCAINSLIQIICRNDYLRKIILNETYEIGTISYEIQEIIDMMHNKNHSLNPKKFIKHLYTHFDGIFTQGEQLDIGELWMFLFEKINSENEKRIVNDKMYYHNFSLNFTSVFNEKLSQDKELMMKCNETMKKINNNKTSLWLDNVQGIMLNIIECKKCKKNLYNFEPFTSIPIDIPDGVHIISLVSMLRNYLKTQECCGDWKCENCKEHTSYKKYCKLWKMPCVLIFIVKRFANIYIKNTTPIDINKNIFIKAGSVISDINRNYDYKFSSMALHYGNLQGGHYCALCDIGDKFVLYDDLNITPFEKETEKKILDKNKDAYMIVYSLNN